MYTDNSCDSGSPAVLEPYGLHYNTERTGTWWLEFIACNIIFAIIGLLLNVIRDWKILPSDCLGPELRNRPFFLKHLMTFLYFIIFIPLGLPPFKCASFSLHFRLSDLPRLPQVKDPFSGVQKQSWAVPACWAGCRALKWQRKGWGRERRGERMSLWWCLAKCFLLVGFQLPLPQPSPGLI